MRGNGHKLDEQARIEIEKLQEEVDDTGQKMKADMLNEAELELDIRALRGGEGRRGSNASRCNGCCLDSAILQQSVAMGAEQVRQQFAILQKELNKVFEVPNQPPPVTLVHVPKGHNREKKQSAAEGDEEWDEEQRKSENNPTPAKERPKDSIFKQARSSGPAAL